MNYRVRKDKYGVDVTAISPKPEVSGLHPYATLSIGNPREVPNFETWANNYGKTSEYQHITGRDDDPTELFTHVPPEISGAYADPKIRHALPTMVGLAMHKLGAQFDVPMADSSLTPYSAALSKNAVNRGLAVPHYDNPEMETEGEFDHDTGEWVNTRPNVRGMPRMRAETLLINTNFHGPAASPQQVADARSWVKGRLRPKAVRGESQFKEDPRSQAHQEWQEGGIHPGPDQGKLF